MVSMRLTVQLYTVRDPLAADYVGTLTALREIGLEYVEFAGNYGESPEATKALLDKLGLKASGAHVGLPEIENDFAGVVATHRTLGNTNIIVPYAGQDLWGDGWDKLGVRLAAAGAKLRAEGFTLGYHNHDFEFVDVDGTPGLDVLYGAASADDLKAQLDLAWVKIGGQDPASYIKKYGSRVKFVHLKDYDPTAEPRWKPAGQGVLDYDTVIPAALEAGVEFGGIELDQSPGDSIEAVRESFAFLSSKGLR